jgi:diguanylate cyclase (GGDEF)-like protein/PAS domain S-box-containing protein
MSSNSRHESYGHSETWNAHDVLRAVVSNSNDAVTVQDFDGQILAWNGAAEVMYGHCEAEALGRNILEFIPESRHDEMQSWADCLWHGRAIAPFETKRIGKDGRIFDIRFTGAAVRDTSNNARAVVTTEREITTRKDGERNRRNVQEEVEERVEERTLSLRQANHELLAEKNMFQVTLDCIGDAVITTDKGAKITYLNPVAEALSGWSNSEASGLPSPEVFNIFTEATREPAEDPVANCLRSGEVRRLAGDTLLIRRDGQELSIDDTAAPIFNAAREMVGAVLIFRDVTDKRQLLQQLSHQAVQDALTGLENRRGFERCLKQVLDSPEAHRDSALLYLDLDQFKVVNDTGGHAAGDMLLRHVGALMHADIRTGDRLARLGGDEFGILLENCPKEQARSIADHLRETIGNFRFEWETKIFTIGASIGVVPIPQTGATLSSLLIAADAACYAAKERGGNRVHVYEPDDSMLLQRHGEMQWVGRIKDALRNDRFSLYYQPIVSLVAKPAAGEWSEILIRLLDEQCRLILPGQFTPAAEHYGLITEVDRWVFRHALEALQLRGSTPASVIYSINVSGQSLSDQSFLAFAIEELRRTKVNPAQVCLEITETAAIANLSDAKRFISVFKELGCLFALDDFGTGLSSFAYLRSLSIDYLKVAGRFVKNMAGDPIDYAMVEGIHRIGRVMGIQTIAEHVEQSATLEGLKTIGVEYAQGNMLGRPRALKARAAGTS